MSHKEATMRVDNEKLIEKLVQLKIFKTETDKTASDTDITYTDELGNTYRVAYDKINDSDLPLTILVEQLDALKSIKSMMAFFTFLTGAGIIAFLFWGLTGGFF